MRFRYLRIFFSDLVLLPVLVYCLLNVSLVTYGIRMAHGQLNLVLNARPVEEVLNDPSTSEKTRRGLELIQRIRQFAFDSIGLNRNENYTQYFDQQGQRLMYVVTAAERFELKAHLWHFPWLGDVPYKGYFDSTAARTEYDRLIAEGLDADIGGASGWSTLGWFKDPILSSMLNRSEGDLAELIIHELTHGTIFVTDSVEYNENLAQFVGVEGAKWYLKTQYGDSSAELKNYLASLEDEKIRNDFMVRQSQYLDSTYKTGNGLPVNAKELLKRHAFQEIVTRAFELDLVADTTFATRIKARINKSGNTVFLQYLRYEGKHDDFSAEYARAGNNLRKFVESMKLKYGAEG